MKQKGLLKKYMGILFVISLFMVFTIGTSVAVTRAEGDFVFELEDGYHYQGLGTKDGDGYFRDGGNVTVTSGKYQVALINNMLKNGGEITTFENAPNRSICVKITNPDKSVSYFIGMTCNEIEEVGTDDCCAINIWDNNLDTVLKIANSATNHNDFSDSVYYFNQNK